MIDATGAGAASTPRRRVTGRLGADPMNRKAVDPCVKDSVTLRCDIETRAAPQPSSKQRGTTNDPQDSELLHSLTVSGSVAPAAVSVKRAALNLRTDARSGAIWARGCAAQGRGVCACIRRSAWTG